MTNVEMILVLKVVEFLARHMRLKKYGNSRVGVDPRILFWQDQDGGLEGSWVAVSALKLM